MQESELRGYYWQAWFDGGTDFVGVTEEDFAALPTHGIIQAKEFRPGISDLVHHGLSYFFFEGGQIISTNDLSLYAVRPQGVKNVKVGRWCNNHVYEAAVKEATGVKH